jgi:hypothetical protein
MVGIRRSHALFVGAALLLGAACGGGSGGTPPDGAAHDARLTDEATLDVASPDGPTADSAPRDSVLPPEVNAEVRPADAADGGLAPDGGGPTDASDARLDLTAAPDTRDAIGAADGPPAEVDVGPCPGGEPGGPRCDDGDPCTGDRCEPTGCGHDPLDGAACDSICGPATCRAGICDSRTACDDHSICTVDSCGQDGTCRHQDVDPVGWPAMDFQLTDLNPYSATSGQVFSLESLSGKVVVLTFMASDCAPCCLQGEAARSVVTAVAEEPDVFFAAVDTRSILHGDDPASIAACVTADGDGTPPLVSVWPYLRDNDESQVWNAYCADNYRTVVIDTARVVRFYRVVNFEDGPAREELLEQIEAIRGE